MAAKLLIRQRVELTETAFAEIVVWQLAVPIVGCKHLFKYRLAFVVNGLCVLRYDNEAGKGDHRHWRNKEQAYRFTTPSQLVADFHADIRRYQDEHSEN